MELMTSQALDAGIASIGKRAKALDTDIHKYGVQALLHAQTHNDPRKLDNLLKALGKAHRAEAFKLWVSAFSPIVWNGDGTIGMHKEKNKKGEDNPKYVPFNIPGADAIPFWDFTAENKSKALTLEAMKKIVAALDAKLKKAIAADLIAENENVEEMREFARKCTQLAA